LCAFRLARGVIVAPFIRGFGPRQCRRGAIALASANS
jgi:hypothetical protein